MRRTVGVLEGADRVGGDLDAPGGRPERVALGITAEILEQDKVARGRRQLDEALLYVERSEVLPEAVRPRIALDDQRLATVALLEQSVGSARETVTSAIGALEREGFLVRNGRSYLLAVSPSSLAT